MNYKLMYDLLLMNTSTNEELLRIIPENLIDCFYDLADLEDKDNFEEYFVNALDNKNSLINEIIELYLFLLLENTSKEELIELAKENIEELEEIHGGFDIEEDLEGAELIIIRLALENGTMEVE